MYIHCTMHYKREQSTQRVLNDEDEVLSPSYDLAPSTPRQKARPATHRRTEKERQPAVGGGGERGWEGAKSFDVEKAWSSIKHSILPKSTVLKVTSYWLNHNWGVGCRGSTD
jgi:hypothetical protein